MNPDFSLEEQFSGLVAGVDEAGCGPWAGPVVAAAVVFLPESRELIWLREITDSKKLSHQKRAAVNARIVECPAVLTGFG
ncbi:MAG: ribonuclease HII, partial [Alphaproteobacteria bacterium]